MNDQPMNDQHDAAFPIPYGQVMSSRGVGFTKRQLAAILLRLPDSGCEWLDSMISASLPAIKATPDTPELPRINIRCECSDGVVHGSTYLDVKRVDQEDDGSFTAVTDVWPGTGTATTTKKDSWIEWAGDDNPPVPPRTKVAVRFRDESIGVAERRAAERSASGDYPVAENLRWNHVGAGGDIMAYRVIEPQPKEQTWVVWHGADSASVPPDALVAVILRGDGPNQESVIPSIEAKHLSWKHCGVGSDVIAYRTLKGESVQAMLESWRKQKQA